MVNVFSNVWRILIGCMPSGFYETSHGNSWVVALWFYMYVHDVIVKNPGRAGKLRQYLREHKVGICVFGDDHNGFCPKDVHDIINEAGYKKYIKTFGMEIRDNRDNLTFFSELGSVGEVKDGGIVFLKKYFIEAYSDWVSWAKDKGKVMSPVLPFRTLSSALHKLFIGNNWKKTEGEYCLSALGMIYENAGINPEIHWIANRLYANCMVAAGYKTNNDFKEHILATVGIGEEVTRNMRKAGISLEQLFSGLPNMDMLKEMHCMDETKADFVPFVDGYDPGQDKDVDDFSIYTDNKSCVNPGYFKDKYFS